MHQPKEMIYSNLQASVADFAFNKYQMQWQRISQMQQNASILLAIITFSITLVFQVINIQKNSIPVLDNQDWNQVLLPAIISALFLGVLSVVFLIKVIMPKQVKKDLPLPGPLYNELLITLEKNVVKSVDGNPGIYEYDIEPQRYIGKNIADRISESVIEINDLVEENQKNYTKGLAVSVFSLIINILLYLLVITNFIPRNAWQVVWYGILLVFSISGLILSLAFNSKFFKLKENHND
jgi:hypothetical protein